MSLTVSPSGKLGILSSGFLTVAIILYKIVIFKVTVAEWTKEWTLSEPGPPSSFVLSLASTLLRGAVRTPVHHSILENGLAISVSPTMASPCVTPRVRATPVPGRSSWGICSECNVIANTWTLPAGESCALPAGCAHRSVGAPKQPLKGLLQSIEIVAGTMKHGRA